MAADAARRKNLLIGKTIAKVTQCYDGGRLFDLEIKFTDGSDVSFLVHFAPGFECTFFPAEVKGKDVKSQRVRIHNLREA